ncbi:hypothetical protein DCC85_03725 [Paenibacillus sp. CAA11]|uniref:hypothetical protein n=1 Tax=Paenibacillus sp. CAA11 TaxID=1532905 RepID=UPI000D36B9CF|nr:hypothetical protein [Paenibacillus sp. CAA11]AWB43418.1 hypothetical protein DCC85_03725 [Paenibacillus sp. CAA11]
MKASDYAIQFDNYIRNWCQLNGLSYNEVVDKICGVSNLPELAGYLANNGIDPKAAFGSYSR